MSRDVSKAFDKVWHNGLKFKLLEINLPEVILKLLCSFIDNRQAHIKMGKTIGPAFTLSSGVPQGSVLSPTLFNFYTRDIPPPAIGCHQIIFADDHTQIITYPNTRAKQMLATKTAREIKKVNEYERKWKIATNPNKFQLLAISVRTPANVIVDNTHIQHNNTIKILGVKLTKTGINSHVHHNIQRAQAASNRLKRFRAVHTNTYLTLYKTLVRPILEYPPILLIAACNTKHKQLQAQQNKNTRRAFKERPPYFNTIQQLTERASLETLNTRLHRLSNKSWDTLSNIDPHLIEISRELNRLGTRDNRWWPRLSPRIECEPPDPIFHIFFLPSYFSLSPIN